MRDFSGARWRRSALRAVDVSKRVTGRLEILGESRGRWLSAQVTDERLPPRALYGGAQVLEHNLTGLAIEVHGAARGQKREVGLDLITNRPAIASHDRAQAVREAELAAVLPDQVDDGQMALALGAAQAAPELLSKDSRRGGRAQQQQAVNVGHVDPLPQHLD